MPLIFLNSCRILRQSKGNIKNVFFFTQSVLYLLRCVYFQYLWFTSNQSNLFYFPVPYMKLSKLALPWTALLISIITLKLYNIIFMNLDFFIPPKIEHYIMASKSIDTAHVCLIVITCFFYRFHPTFKCFNKAMKMFPKIKSSDSAPRIRYFSVILFIYNLTLIFIKILFHPSIHSFVFVYIPDFVMTSACLSVSSLIASVNITASLSYKFINRKILDLFTLKNNESLVIKNLSHVSELCWETGELLLLTWKYFSLDLLVRCIFIILKGLYLSHILYNLKKSGLSSNLYQTTSFLTILMWLIEIFVLGKICEEVECQVIKL